MAFIWVDCSKSARNEESSSRGAFKSGLASVDSGLQVNLEIALSGASAKVKPPNRAFQPGRKCVETSDDVIEDDFIRTPASCIWDFSPMPSGAAKDDFYEVHPGKDKRGADLISDALPIRWL
jgi:hypothetical protein